jgi:hypothetical protein
MPPLLLPADDSGEGKKKAHATNGVPPPIRRAQRLGLLVKRLPADDAATFRVKRDPSAAREGPGEFSPARHLGERGDAARGNQSGPRVHAGTAVRWAAGADLAAPSAVRAVPPATSV